MQKGLEKSSRKEVLSKWKLNTKFVDEYLTGQSDDIDIERKKPTPNGRIMALTEKYRARVRIKLYSSDGSQKV